MGALISWLATSQASKSGLRQLKLQLQHSERSELNKLKRERYEELYILIDHWSKAFFGNFLYLRLVMEGKLSYDEYLDKFIENAKSKTHDFNRISMILDIYGDELRPLYNDVLALRNEWNSIETQHKNAYKAGIVETPWFIEPSIEVQKKLENACDKLLAGIASSLQP